MVLTDAEFAQLRTLLARLAGLVFDESRRDSVAFCIAERLRVTGVPDVYSYLPLLQSPAERQELLNEVTIQETHFFRNPPQIRALRRHVVPELLRVAESQGRRLRVWSAGCSTGEEAYSVAMLLRELLPTTAGWDVKVVATDVSARALDAARAGRYGDRAVQMASPEELARFFVRDGGHWVVRPEVRELVEFRHHNLVTEPVPFGPDERVDLVLCRNVTIYFSRQTTRALMKRLHTCLRDGGYLFLGHSETLWQVSEDFRLVPLGSGEDAAFVYRRLDAGPGERRAVLPDRRTADEPVAPERRVAPRRTRTPPPVAVPAARPAASAPSVRGALAEGRYDEAAEAAGLLVAAAPLDAAGFYLRGLARVNAGRDADAVVDLRKAVYLEPGNGLAHFLLAGTLARLGAASAAAREYAAAADTLRPQDASVPELGGRSVEELAAMCRRLAVLDAPPVGELS
ncbi:MAG: protein-glutamate O-methyltransferase CheR [Actinobacteria bacterium]|nr:protein-glutamate O-methyltransferase CheR [Actinomycetota bacterium]